MNKYCISSIIIAALLSGCSAIGPTNSAAFAELIQAPIPKSEGSTQFYGPAVWFPNHRGFTDIRSAFVSGGGQAIPGALVITEKAIFFEQWDEKARAYDIIKRLSMNDVMSATVDSFGRGRRLVVRKKDFSFDSFEFANASGTIIDGEKTEAAAAFLQKHLPEKDAGI